MLGKVIKDYMKENGIKQQFIAEEIGTTPQTLGAMLNGQRKIEATEYFNICKALKVDISYFAIKIGVINAETTTA